MRFPEQVPTLTDGDVTLRAHRVDDVPAIVEQCTDPVSLEWTTVPRGYNEEMGVEFVTTSIPEMWKSDKEFIFAIESTHPDGERRFGGSLSLRDEGARRAEVAFGAHPAIRDRGVMTTAVNLLLDWGFSARDLETVSWLTNEGNVASRRVAWKTGFTFGGTMRRWLDHRGDYPNAWIGALHKDDPREPASEWYDVPVIESKRLRLRPLKESDIPRIVEASADERAQHWLSFMPSPYTEQDARDFMLRTQTQAIEGRSITWAVADRESDQFLGTIGLPHKNRTSFEVGYNAHPDARGSGVMSEGVSMVVRHLFIAKEDGGMGAQRAFVRAADGNAASQHVARANGFTEYGRERRSEVLGDGSQVDVALFDLLRSEWAG
ncbi:MAG: GNAT family N-acetyltransferase [Nocardioidaceae bacterium]